MEIKQEKQWSRHYSNKGHDEIKVYYRCNQVKYRGKQCNAAIYLYYRNDSDKVELYRLITASTRLYADATYKLNWQGFLVLIVRTSDYNRKLHPFGLAVCSDEKQQDFEFIFKSISDGVEKFTESKFTPEILIADGSGDTRNAFMEKQQKLY
jgi:hypothetical protein